MQLHITGRHMEITPALKTFIEEKMERLNQRHPLSTLSITLRIENVTHFAEATAHLHGIDLHAEAESSDMYAALDLLVDKLTVQLTKHKEKLTSHRDS